MARYIAYLTIGWLVSFVVATIIWQVLGLPIFVYWVIAFGGGVLGGYVASNAARRRLR